MTTSGSFHASCSAISYPIVFFPSTRYGSFSVETSNHPSASFRCPTIRPQSSMRPSTSVTWAPYASHSIRKTFGVSRGMKT